MQELGSGSSSTDSGTSPFQKVESEKLPPGAEIYEFTGTSLDLGEANLTGPAVNIGQVSPMDELELPMYNSDSNAPYGTLFWHSGDSQLKFKSERGDIYTF